MYAHELLHVISSLTQVIVLGKYGSQETSLLWEVELKPFVYVTMSRRITGNSLLFGLFTS